MDGFAYGALTLCRRPSQAVPLPCIHVTAMWVVLQPRGRRSNRRFALCPRSLAATRGISFDFSSSGYLDVSVPRVASSQPMCSAGGSGAMAPAGFAHSEIHGSKDMCSSPWLIAACHVLRRLPVPRHPPCALTIFISDGSGVHPGRPLCCISSDQMLMTFIEKERYRALSRYAALKVRGEGEPSRTGCCALASAMGHGPGIGGWARLKSGIGFCE